MNELTSPSTIAARRPCRNWLIALTASAALILGLAVGGILGYTSQATAVAAARHQASQAIQSADQMKAALQEEYQAKVQSLSAQQTALTARQADLDAQQKALDAKTAALKANSFSDGIYQIGRDIQPGVYRETQPTGICYYALLGSSRTSDIIDNNNVNGPATVAIGGSAAFFESVRCGTWTKIG